MSRFAIIFALVWGPCCVAALRVEKKGQSQEAENEVEEDEDLHAVLDLFEALPPEFNTSRLAILADLQSDAAHDVADGSYDCHRNPHMCKAPFHCESWTHQDTLDIRMHGLATPDGHANLRSWCMPGLERYASTVLKECIADGNMRKSAKVTFQRTYKDYSDELDASYCFAEGHCTNKVVSDFSTIDDAEKMCDYRFGRKGWTRNFVKTLKRLFDMPVAFAGLANRKTGIQTQRVTRVISKMACAQGIFHCDVQYCKRTYCRDEYYVSKYSHLLPSYPGNLMMDPDMTKEMREQDQGN